YTAYRGRDKIIDGVDCHINAGDKDVPYSCRELPPCRNNGAVTGDPSTDHKVDPVLDPGKDPGNPLLHPIPDRGDGPSDLIPNGAPDNLEHSLCGIPHGYGNVGHLAHLLLCQVQTASEFLRGRAVLYRLVKER